MTAFTLRDEFAAAVCNLSPTTINRLRHFGIPAAVIFNEPLMLGVATIYPLAVITYAFAQASPFSYPQQGIGQVA